MSLIPKILFFSSKTYTFAKIFTKYRPPLLSNPVRKPTDKSTNKPKQNTSSLAEAIKSYTMDLWLFLLS